MPCSALPPPSPCAPAWRCYHCCCYPAVQPCLGEAAGLIQQVEDAHLGLDEVQHVLVVHKLDVAPLDGLALVLGLLHLEDVLVEVLLQLLVGQVDAKLLKVVLLELLKACRAERRAGGRGAGAGGRLPVKRGGGEACTVLQAAAASTPRTLQPPAYLPHPHPTTPECAP